MSLGWWTTVLRQMKDYRLTNLCEIDSESVYVDQLAIVVDVWQKGTAGRGNRYRSGFARPTAGVCRFSHIDLLVCETSVVF